jgi:hypothetical protein
MQARRTFEHSPEGGWSSVAVHLAAAGPAKEGFYLTLFPDARPPATLFLRPQQVLQLLDMATQSAVSDQQIWDVVAKIPMEPLAPSRTLYPRLRSLLVDCGAAIRAQVRAQLERPRPPASPIGDDIAEGEAPPMVIEAEPEAPASGHGHGAGGGSPDDNGSGVG